MTAEEPLIDLFIQPAKHPYFVKEKSFWTVDRAVSLTQKSKSCAEHGRSFARELPDVGQLPQSHKSDETGSLPSCLLSISRDGICAGRVPLPAVIASDDRSVGARSLSTTAVKAPAAVACRSPWPSQRAQFMSLGSAAPRENLAAHVGEGGRESHKAKTGQRIAAAGAVTAAASADTTVGTATATSTNGSNGLAFLTESIRRKKKNRWCPHSPFDGRDSTKLLSGRCSPLAVDDAGITAARGAFYNPGYDAWLDEDVHSARRSPFDDVECASEASENSTIIGKVGPEMGVFAFRRPSTSSVETTAGPLGSRDTVSVSGSSCHEDDIQPFSLVLHVAEEPCAGDSDGDCIAPGSGSGNAGVGGLPSLTRRLFGGGRHKRDGSDRSGSDSRSGPSRYHRDSGRSPTAAAMPSCPKPSASKGGRNADGCSTPGRTTSPSCDRAVGSVAEILTCPATTLISATSGRPPPHSLSPNVATPSGSVRAAALKSRSCSPSSYSCRSVRLLTNRAAVDAGATAAAAATPPRNPSYGSIDSLAFGVPTLHAAGALWHQQRQQAESSFFDVVIAEPATAVSSSRHCHQAIGRPAGLPVAASNEDSTARQSVVLRHLEQFDFDAEGDDDDGRYGFGDRGNRMIAVRKTERRRRQRRIFTAVALLLAFTLSVGAVTAYLFVSGPLSSRAESAYVGQGFTRLPFTDFSTPSNDHSSRSLVPSNQVRYVGTILLKIDYTPDMADLRSPTAMNLKSHFCNEVKNMYSEHNSTDMIYSNCEVTKLERGSVKVTFKVTFTTKSGSAGLSANATSKRLREFFENEIITSKKLGSFPCDAAYFTMELEVVDSVPSQTPGTLSLPATVAPATNVPPATAADDGFRLDRMVAEASQLITNGSTVASVNRIAVHHDEIEQVDAPVVEMTGGEDAGRLTEAVTEGVSSTHPSVSYYFFPGGHNTTALYLSRTNNFLRQLGDDAEMRRRSGLTSPAVWPTILGAETTTVAASPFHSTPLTSGADRASSTPADVGLSGIATPAGPVVAVSTGKEQPPDAAAAAASTAVADPSAAMAASTVREDAEASLTPTEPTISILAVAAGESNSPEDAGRAQMTSELPQLSTSYTATLAGTRDGSRNQSQAALTATILSPTQAPSVVLSPKTSASVMRMTSMPTIRDVESSAAFSTIVAEKETESLSTVPSLLTGSTPSASLNVRQTVSELGHAEREDKSPTPLLRMQLMVTGTAPLRVPDGTSALQLLSTSMPGSSFEPVQESGLATAGASEMPAPDAGTPLFGEDINRSASSSALPSSVNISMRVRYGTSTAVPDVSEFASLHAGQLPWHTSDSVTSTAAGLASVEASAFSSLPARDSHTSTESEIIATSPTLWSSESFPPVVPSKTAGIAHATAGITRTTSIVSDARVSMTTAVSVSVQAAAHTNTSETSTVPLTASQRAVASTDSTCRNCMLIPAGNAVIPSLGSTAAAKDYLELTSSSTVSGESTGRYSVGCGVNETSMRPALDNCLAYILCVEGVLQNMNCTAGLYFEPLRNICLPCNVSRCGRCPVSRRERAGDGVAAWAAASAGEGGLRTLASYRSSAAVESVPTPAVTTAPAIVDTAAVTDLTFEGHSAVRIVTSLAIVTGARTSEMRSIANVSGFADQHQEMSTQQSPCHVEGVRADPDDCTAMMYCMKDGSTVQYACDDSEMFSTEAGMCVPCNVSVCNKCGPST